VSHSQCKCSSRLPRSIPDSAQRLLHHRLDEQSLDPLVPLPNRLALVGMSFLLIFQVRLPPTLPHPPSCTEHRRRQRLAGRDQLPHRRIHKGLRIRHRCVSLCPTCDWPLMGDGQPQIRSIDRSLLRHSHSSQVRCSTISVLIGLVPSSAAWASCGSPCSFFWI